MVIPDYGLVTGIGKKRLKDGGAAWVLHFQFNYTVIFVKFFLHMSFSFLIRT